jgi:hypothetical protein
MGFPFGFSPLARSRFACVCVACALSASLAGCGAVLKRAPEPDLPPITKPLSPEQRDAVLDEVGRNFLYGDGLGNTVINVGASIAFPPYLIAVLGNGALSLAGYEPLSISQVMPERVAESYVAGRDAVVSAPGRTAAAVAGEEYRTDGMAKKAIKSAMLAPNEETRIR